MSGNNNVFMRFFYGGKFVQNCSYYVGGRERVREVDKDTINYWSLQDVVEELLGEKAYKLYCKKPFTDELSAELCLLSDDVCVREMLEHVKTGMTVEFYIEIEEQEDRINESLVHEGCGSNYEQGGNCDAIVHVADVQEDTHYEEQIYNSSSDEEADRDENLILEQVDQDSCNDDDEVRIAREKIKEHAKIRKDSRKKLRIQLQEDNVEKEVEEIPHVTKNESQHIIAEINTTGINNCSVYYDSSDAISVHSEDIASDADDAQRKIIDKSLLYDPDAPLRDFFVQQQFSTATVLREALRKYSYVRRYAIKYKKNDKERILMICCDDSCKWRLRCAFVKRTGQWMVKSYQSVHSCKETKFNKRVTSKVVAEHLKDIILDMPSIKTTTIQMLIWLKMRADITPMQCRKAKYFIFKDKNQEYLRLTLKLVNKYLTKVQPEKQSSVMELKKSIARLHKERRPLLNWCLNQIKKRENLSLNQ